MHEPIVHLLQVWLLGLFLTVVLRAARAPTVTDRLLAVDMLSPLLITLLSVLALYRGDRGYLLVALAVSLVGYVQTAVTARVERERRGEP